MKIEKFVIENYRALEHVQVNLKHSINPIIGVNESGKTSILNALLAFDKKRDRLNKGQHLVFNNRYVTNPDQQCRIYATVCLDSSEFKDLVVHCKLRTDSPEYDALLELVSEDHKFEVCRELRSKTYSCESPGLPEKVNAKITTFLVKHIPYVLYFDDFTDRVPDKITFDANYIATGALSTTKIRDWQEIIQEIFRRAELSALKNYDDPLAGYLQIEDSDTREDTLSDIQDTLNREITDEWHSIKSRSNAMADDVESLSIVIKESNSTFTFKVKDTSAQDRSRTFNISDRSKGFQWYFNYMVKLKFNPNYQNDLENSIFLLDEPGSYLHSSAQRGLLDELHRVSEKNTIVYCTHSQFLLDPAVIKVGSIKIAQKHDGKVQLDDYGTYGGTKSEGALTPIYQALNLNFNHDFVGYLVITEGTDDFYFFSMLRDNLGIIDPAIKFVPGAGASQLTTLISFAMSHADDFLVALDNDEAGHEWQKKYTDDFGEMVGAKIHTYCPGSTHWVLEDFLCEQDKEKLYALTEVSDPKRALGFLFYDYKHLQSEFFANLSERSLSNLNSTVAFINQLSVD